MDTIKRSYETIMPVCDFQREGFSEGRREAFERASTSEWHARRSARGELKSVLSEAQSRKVRISALKFSEFDSGNISHANAYWDVELEGPKELVELFLKEWLGLTDEELAEQV